MADRRVGDRRDRENGVIRIETKRAIIYIAIAVVLIASISANIVLAVRLKAYKDAVDYFDDSQYKNISFDEEETDEDSEEPEVEIENVN